MEEIDTEICMWKIKTKRKQRKHLPVSKDSMNIKRFFYIV